VTTDHSGRLAGRTAIVTGGAQGMGEATARALHAAGAHVVVADVQDDAGTAIVAGLGGSSRFHHLDVRDPAEWAALAADVETEFGTIDVLVNNAGVSGIGAIEDWDEARLRRVVDINLVGMFHGIQAVIPAMRRAGGGSIVNFGSLGAMQAFPLMSGYVASKWAVRGLTKAAAIELGVHGIRVNAVHPGQITTPMTAGAHMETDHVALKRLGVPEDIADIVVFLAGAESRFVTGADIVADGGEHAGPAAWSAIPG
jgi:3alpha(or 20beta)-hydroxysteroid dehydrogenase